VDGVQGARAAIGVTAGLSASPRGGVGLGERRVLTSTGRRSTGWSKVRRIRSSPRDQTLQASLSEKLHRMFR